MQKFSIKDALASGWEIFRSRVVFLLIIAILSALVSSIPNIFSIAIPFLDKYLGVVLLTAVYIAAIYLQLAISMGMISIYLKLIEKHRVEIKELFSFLKLYRRVFHYLIASIIYGIVIGLLPAILLIAGALNQNFMLMGAGFILLLVLAVFFGIRLQFYTYFIVEKNKSGIDSLKASANISKGSIMHLFIYTLTTILLAAGGLAIIALVAWLLGAFRGNIAGITLGIAAYLVGIFCLSNILYLSHAYIYRKLLTATKS